MVNEKNKMLKSESLPAFKLTLPQRGQDCKLHDLEMQFSFFPRVLCVYCVGPCEGGGQSVFPRSLH